MMFKFATEQHLAFLKRYGKIGIAVHMSLSAVSLGGWWLLVSSGVDVVKLGTKIGIDLSDSSVVSSTSTFAIAYGIHKLTMPLRLPISVAITPLVARALARPAQNTATNIAKIKKGK
mmetsp:Transcript_13083/g.21185  ORF Transcript_13083/g.21185 Transcript_13083/m.21185 type:complete len:117 (+) Transcript_13083:1713-2063(+)